MGSETGVGEAGLEVMHIPLFIVYSLELRYSSTLTQSAWLPRKKSKQVYGPDRPSGSESRVQPQASGSRIPAPYRFIENPPSALSVPLSSLALPP